MEKALLPQVWYLVLNGGDKSVRGPEGVGRSVMVEQVGEVGEDLVMEGFMSERKDSLGMNWSLFRTLDDVP